MSPGDFLFLRHLIKLGSRPDFTGEGSHDMLPMTLLLGFIFVLPQTSSDRSVSFLHQFPPEPYSPQAFCEFKIEYLVFLGRCHITEQVVSLISLILLASSSPLSILTSSFLSSLLDHPVHSASLSLM